MAAKLISRIVSDDNTELFNLNGGSVCHSGGFSYGGNPDVIPIEESEGVERIVTAIQTLPLLFSDANSFLRMKKREELKSILSAGRRAIANKMVSDYIYWEFYQEGELPKRALIFGGEVTHDEGYLGRYYQKNRKAMAVTLDLQLMPYNENCEAVMIPESGYITISGKGGAIPLPQLGSQPGRIARLEIRPASEGSQPDQTIIVGIRPFPPSGNSSKHFDGELDIGKELEFASEGSEAFAFSDSFATMLPSVTDFSAFVGRHILIVNMGWDDGKPEFARLKVGTSPGSLGLYSEYSDEVDYETDSEGDNPTRLIFEPINIPNGGSIYRAGERDISVMSFGISGTLFTGGVSSPYTIEFGAAGLVPAESLLITNSGEMSTFGLNEVVQQFDTLPDDSPVVSRGLRVVDSSGDPTHEPLRSSLIAREENWKYPCEGGYLCVWNSNFEDVGVRLEVFPRWELFRYS